MSKKRGIINLFPGEESNLFPGVESGGPVALLSSGSVSDLLVAGARRMKEQDEEIKELRSLLLEAQNAAQNGGQNQGVDGYDTELEEIESRYESETIEILKERNSDLITCKEALEKFLRERTEQFFEKSREVDALNNTIDTLKSNLDEKTNEVNELKKKFEEVDVEAMLEKLETIKYESIHVIRSVMKLF